MNAVVERIRRLMLLCLMLICSQSWAEDEAAASFSGYAKSYALWQDALEVSNGEPLAEEQWQLQNSLRLMLDYFPSERLSLQLHYEVQPIYRDKPSGLASAGGAFSTLSSIDNRYRIKDISNPDDGDHWLLLQNLDRLNLRYSTERGDLTIGRQVVSFGSARFVNPTDIFVPFGLQTLNQEYRVGIDAIRYQAALGDFAQLDMGAVIGADGERENSGLFLRGRDNWEGRDVQGIVIALDQAWLIGGGLETAIGDYGFWLETAYVDADVEIENNTNTHTNSKRVRYWRHSIGSDYALNERWIVMLEYHYNGAGSDDPQDYAGLLALQPYQQGGVYLLGRHYLIPALNWQASPLINVNGSGFFNLEDDSCFISLVADISWSENLYSDLGLYWSRGEGLSLEESPIATPALQFGSEFGNYPLSVYASLRWYF